MSGMSPKPASRSSSPRAVSRGRRGDDDDDDSISQNSISRATSIARLGSPIPGTGVTRPSQPSAEQSNDELAAPLFEPDVSKNSIPVPGESTLAKALRDYSGRNSPPRFGTPPIRTGSPISTSHNFQTNYGSFGQNSGHSGDREQPYENYDIVRKHLVTGNSNNAPLNPAGLGKYGSPSGSIQHPGKSTSEEEFSSLQLQGGDIHRQIYRLTEQQEEESQGQGKYRRSRSFHATERIAADRDIPDIGTIKQPGGFRRNYLIRSAVSPSPGPSTRNRGVYGEPTQPRPQPFTSNFIEFLSLYGHFAGEQLDEDDEVLGPDEYFSSDAYDGAGEESDEEQEPRETSALLTPGKRRRRRKEQKAGDTSPSGAALLLLKSFVGTGVLFLPKAFLNGGMLFSTFLLLTVSILSFNCFILLVNTRLKVEHSFGDMGKAVYGNWMRNMINTSLVISQIGFTSAYIVFVAENLQGFIQAVTNCRTTWDIKYLIVLQMVVFLPVSLYRNISRIQAMALVADVFIVLGLVYLYYFDIFTIATQHGIADISWFNRQDWTLFIGTAIFTFEGIGLVIPIQTAMREPKKFPTVLGGVMVGITVIFTSMGALSYAAFGSKTKAVVILNMPQDDKFVNGVQFIYSLAILLSIPLQLFPAIEISSQQLFSKTGKYNPYIKWKKNFFRFFMVIFCACVAWIGADDLDKFVSLVGSFACIPLVYIYPPLLHYKAVATTRAARIWDIILCIIGVVAMTYTSALTVNSWISGSGNQKQPGYCDN